MDLARETDSAAPCATGFWPAGRWATPSASRVPPVRSWHRNSRALRRCRPSNRFSDYSKGLTVRDEDRRQLQDTRFFRPEAIAEAAQRRERRSSLAESGRLLIIAADHAARGVIDV